VFLPALDSPEEIIGAIEQWQQSGAIFENEDSRVDKAPQIATVCVMFMGQTGLQRTQGVGPKAIWVPTEAADTIEAVRSHDGIERRGREE
jgi:hypothetical protein